MSLTPAQDNIEAQRRRDTVEKCGKNMGPHDFIPIEFLNTPEAKRVTRLLCRVCFCNVAVKMLLENYPEVKL